MILLLTCCPQTVYWFLVDCKVRLEYVGILFIFIGLLLVIVFNVGTLEMFENGGSIL